MEKLDAFVDDRVSSGRVIKKLELSNENTISVGKKGAILYGVDDIREITTCDVAGSMGWVQWFEIWGDPYKLLYRINPNHVSMVIYE